MAATNNVTRMLDAQEIIYTAFEIPLVKLTALEVCDHLQIPPEEVFKTIVLRPEKSGKPVLAVVPATGEVDPKKLAIFFKGEEN